LFLKAFSLPPIHLSSYHPESPTFRMEKPEFRSLEPGDGVITMVRTPAALLTINFPDAKS
ncbi:MAG: hypothetical protein KAR13_09890, partial [Desulfobulbaceae bacterium]|nr:hypothetical protein [Desulfobulbaceae bacterium]